VSTNTPPPKPACGFVVAGRVCGGLATRQLPAGAAGNPQPLPLCDLHAVRFADPTTALR
jgi:hypothetical protein